MSSDLDPLKQSVNSPQSSGQEPLSTPNSRPTSLDKVQTRAREPLVYQSRVEGLRRQREKTRGELASRLLWLIIGTAIGSFILITVDLINNSVKNQQPALDTNFASDIITLLITTQSTLAGSAIGFYFGNKQSDDK